MNTAGAPAPEQPPVPPQVRPVSAGRRDSSPAVAPEPPSPLTAFLVEGARRREEHTRTEPQRPEFWAHPDPGAAAVSALGHPVDRALSRRKPGRNRRDFAGAIRRACERVIDAADGDRPDGRPLTDAEVRAYPWHHIDLDLAAAYRDHVYATFRKQSSRNDAVCAVRAVVTECYRAGLISALRRDRLFEELTTTAPGRSTKRRRLSQKEINALLHACETTGSVVVQARNTAIVALFRTSGMRIGELVLLELSDYDAAASILRLRDTKNGRDHDVFLHPHAVPYLERWIDLRGDRPGALFTSVFRLNDPASLHPHSVRWMLRDRAKAAGVAAFGSHDFRRTFATELLRTHDVALVGKLLNHTKTSSTLIYDLAGEDEQRAAVQAIPLPTLPSPGAAPAAVQGEERTGTVTANAAASTVDTGTHAAATRPSDEVA